ncbi:MULTISPECIES: 3-hydroxybutyrate dehydrogenase [Pandoraea]|jgi:3-hydroxybutyrate dehydrogenase|nr:MULTISPECIES: 3-hydroxybutyrate dehydrogenase [Pandoraea]AHB06880.2 3-hydroxybutyrate dehydrogenase [Pandoraea pnomenusa 3kgm]AHB77001.2 3-hydroxybutyrate dehydrogenase [Pandoraea pnomenusa]AHN74645.2 3-hydroxybutyrate dehydrogenase [Pandoraea pnomenusa]AIU28800.1 3-hydroxybutyrate dehydrogenase [Pandoraea pnomenusa]ANC45797.1 3-hydroxybutyrate dehydrogenase [Pandoraea pnomenusa]
MDAAMRLNGKTALITGSTSGIGLGIAQALARAGANIVLNGFGDVEAARRAVESTGAHAIHLPADMRRADEIEHMFDVARERFGGVDILVNNAGIQHVAPIESFPAQQWDDIIAINLTSAFHTTRHALAGMRERNWGRIVNIASVHGLVGSAGKSAYVAAKHGLVGLTKVTALETATTGVTCNAICPGFVLTPLVQKQIDDLALREGLSADDARTRLLGEKQPSGQFVTPEMLGSIALMLCSPMAAEVRGATWAADGGWTAQ